MGGRILPWARGACTEPPLGAPAPAGPPQGCNTMHMDAIQSPTQPTRSRLGPGPWARGPKRGCFGYFPRVCCCCMALPGRPCVRRTPPMVLHNPHIYTISPSTAYAVQIRPWAWARAPPKWLFLVHSSRLLQVAGLPQIAPGPAGPPQGLGTIHMEAIYPPKHPTISRSR